MKPFGCSSCRKTFSRKDALNRHLTMTGCGTDAERRPRMRRGRKKAAGAVPREADAAKAEEGAHSVEVLVSAVGTPNVSEANRFPSDREDEENGEREEDFFDDERQEQRPASSN